MMEHSHLLGTSMTSRHQKLDVKNYYKIELTPCTAELFLYSADSLGLTYQLSTSKKITFVKQKISDVTAVEINQKNIYQQRGVFHPSQSQHVGNGLPFELPL